MDRIAFQNLVVKIASAAIDIALRAALLETAAGLPAGSWSRNLRRFRTEGPITFPQADPAWFDGRGEFMYRSLIKGAKAVLHSQESAEDVVGEVFAKDWLIGLARGLVSKGSLTSGATGFSQAQGLLFNRGRQWALDIVRSKRHRSEETAIEVGVSDDDTYRHEPSTEWGTQFGERDRAVALLSLMNSDKGVANKVQNYVQRNVPPAAFKVYEAKLANPDMAPKELGAVLFPGSVMGASFVYKSLTKVYKAIADASSKDPFLVDAIDLSLQSEGQHALRLASMGPGTTLFQVFQELGLL